MGVSRSREAVDSTRLEESGEIIRHKDHYAYTINRLFHVIRIILAVCCFIFMLVATIFLLVKVTTITTVDEKELRVAIGKLQRDLARVQVHMAALDKNSNNEKVNNRAFNSKLDSEIKEIEIVMEKYHRKSYKASDGKTYVFSAIRMDYASATEYCKSLNSTLAASGIRDKDVKLNLIENLLKHMSDDDSWIGLDLLKSGDFTYVDDVIATKGNTDWNEGEPNHGGQGSNAEEKCSVLLYKSNYKVNDVSCGLKKYALCEN